MELEEGIELKSTNLKIVKVGDPWHRRLAQKNIVMFAKGMHSGHIIYL